MRHRKIKIGRWGDGVMGRIENQGIKIPGNHKIRK